MARRSSVILNSVEEKKKAADLKTSLREIKMKIAETQQERKAFDKAWKAQIADYERQCKEFDATMAQLTRSLAQAENAQMELFQQFDPPVPSETE